MADDTSTISPEKGWLADLNWRAYALFLVFSLFSGYSGGSIAPKGAAQGISQETADVRYLKAEKGITQDQGDVRYITKEEADKRGEKRDKQNERIEEKIDGLRNLLNQILINQQSEKK